MVGVGLVLAVGAGQERTMGMLLNDSAAFRGYTLFAPLPYTETYLIDNEGRLVHSWPGELRPGDAVSFGEDGLLLRTLFTHNPVFGAGGAGGRVEMVEWEGNVGWAFDYSDSLHCQHHDAIRMPGGNVLMVAWEYKTLQEALEAGRDRTKLFENCLWPDHLVEVDPETDSMVWEWHVWDHLIQDYDSTRRNYGVVADHPELVDLNFLGMSALGYADWNHSNAVAYNPELDQVVVSVRQFSELWVIDHSTTTAQARGHAGGRYGRGGDLLYRWGNPRAYRRGIVGSRRLFGQHDGQWNGQGLPGAGRILVFNNGVGRPGGGYSTVDEIVPPESAGFYRLGPDSTYGPTAAAWQYAATPPRSWYAALISGCQRMPNGNTLVCSGTQGTLFEVTRDSQLVWKYVNPVCESGPMYQYEPVPPGSNQVFKVRRYAPDYPGFAGRNLEPGSPIERYRQATAEPAGPVGVDWFQAEPAAGGRVRVRLALSSAAAVRLRVLDVSGREVTRVPARTYAPGRHELELAACGAGSGMWFAVCEAGGRRAVRSLVRLKPAE
jgi:hypothetical protein